MEIPSKGTIVSVDWDGCVQVGRVEDVLFAESDPDEAELFVRFPDGDAAWVHFAELRTSVGGVARRDL